MEPLSCSNANWWLSFDKEGWSSCAKKNRYIKGFQRNPPKQKSDPIYMLEEAKCCTAIPLWDKLDAECFEANWWLALDKYVEYLFGNNLLHQRRSFIASVFINSFYFLTEKISGLYVLLVIS